MPRYDLRDTTKISQENTALMRARLYLHAGKHRLQKGSSAAGIAALYDSVLFGMRYYIAKHRRCASFVENIDLWDAVGLFHALTRAGAFDDPFTFNRFSLIVEHVLWEESFSFDADAVLMEVEKMLTKLGVMPFIERR